MSKDKSFCLKERNGDLSGQQLFSGNTFYHEKGKVDYHFGKSLENRDFIKFSVITPKKRYFLAKITLKSRFQRFFARF
jgi:hypothetical protein